MSTPVLFEVTCHHCKAVLKVNNISISVPDAPGAEPARESSDIHCPHCKKPVFKISTRKIP